MESRRLLFIGVASVILATGARADQSRDRFGARIDTVKQILSSDPRGFTGYGALTLFYASNYLYGKELWRTDGTGSGTQLVKDLRPGPMYDETTSCLVEVNGALLFTTEDPYDGAAAVVLWRTDGTAEGTVRLRTVPGFLDLNEDPIRFCQLVKAGNAVFFLVFERTSLVPQRIQVTLWKSDGSAEGTQVVHTFSDSSTFDTSMVASNDLVFFRAQAPGEGLEPWRSDGTAAGTFRLGDIAAGEDNSFPWSFVATDDGACFTASSEEGPSAIRHLWCSDGTPAGTHRKIRVGNSFIPGPVFQGSLLFQSRIDDQYGLWATDGTAVGTRSLASGEVEVGVFGGALYIFEHSPGVTELLRADGIASGVVPVLELPGSAGGAFVTDDALLFVHVAPSGTRTLVRSDLTTAGTTELTELGEGTVAGHANGAVFLVIDDPVIGREPWILDGSMTVPRLLKNIAVEGGPVCPGDCDGDGTVTISELITAVQLALVGSGSCPAVDGDGDSVVSIAELVAAVASALTSCPN